LHARLEDAEFSFDSFCSVSGLCLHPQSAAEHQGCCIGDAVTMIAPFTGNGMSMAFESAEIAVGPLSQYSEGKTSWESAQTAVAQGCDQAFGRRLKWSRFLQNQFFNGRLGDVLISVGAHAPGLWRFFYSRTR
jgi:flavin-dependent dehydrogenase